MTTDTVPQTQQQSVPATDGEAVTPHNSTNMTNVSRALWVGGAGNITAVMHPSGTVLLFSGIAAGTLLPIRVSRVNSTGTTATLITAIY
jgi:hypothetical protein